MNLHQKSSQTKTKFIAPASCFAPHRISRYALPQEQLTCANKLLFSLTKGYLV